MARSRTARDADRVVDPPEPFQTQANLTERPDVGPALDERAAFWAEQARRLDWFEAWDTVLDWDPPEARWFEGGRLNACYNCVDRHVEAGRGEEPAIVWIGEDGGREPWTFRRLQAATARAANVFGELGVERGDRVTLYMPNVPELAIAMLGLARMGAAHVVVMGGFSPEAAARRADDAGSRLLVTVDGYRRKGETIDQKARADRAADAAETVEQVLVVDRVGRPLELDGEREVGWSRALARVGDEHEPAAVDAEELLFLMHTSGTTGQPKGIAHTTGGYLTGVHATSRWVLDLEPGDVHWCVAELGWITAHSYALYGPLSVGATTVLAEGAPTHPDGERPWRIVEQEGVEVLYTAPTTLRALRRQAPQAPERSDLSSLRLLGSVGEPIQPATWRWYHDRVGGGGCPIVDTWWQTETGMIVVAPLPGVTPLKPGSATRAVPGVEVDVLDEEGRSVDPGGRGRLAIEGPWPAMGRTIWGERDRYEEEYWSRWDRVAYDAGDAARRDEEGYVWLLGRADEVLNVAGHRLGTAEIEAALVDHSRVVEAAVVGRPDEVKGEVPVGFVVTDGDGELGEAQLVRRVEEAVGPIARPAAVHPVSRLPRTRSGKILRRSLRAIACGEEPERPATIVDPSTVRRLQAEVPAPSPD